MWMQSHARISVSVTLRFRLEARGRVQDSGLETKLGLDQIPRYKEKFLQKGILENSALYGER